MAINTQKLLPSAKGSPLLKIKAAKIVPAVSIEKKAIDIQKLMGPVKEEDPKSIQKTLVNIDSSLKLILKEDQNEQSKKKKEKEKADYEREEKKLEAPKEAKKFNLPTLSLPGASFLDRIKRFLFFTALGWLFTRFQDQLPKLEGIVKTIGQVYGVAENIFKSLLSGLVNFIDRGYQAYDKVRDLAKSIGGEKAQQDFDKLSGKLNEYINYVLIGGIALTGAINSFNKAAGISTKNAAKEAAKKTTGEVAKRAVKKGIIQKTAQAARISTRKATQAVIGKQATRQLLRLVKGPLSRLPVLGGLIEFGLSWALGDPVGKAAFRGVGTLLLGAVGSLILPGFGTFIGGVAGAELAGKLYEVLFENKKPQGKVQKKQGGGSVTRGGKPLGGPTRSLKITKRRPQKIKPKQSQPGKDVGGKKNIQKLYPDPSARTEIEGQQKSPWFDLLPTIPPLKENATQDEIDERNKKILERDAKLKRLPNPYKALTGVAKKLKDIPFGIGALMGGAIDIALGEKLPQNAISNLSNGISYLISVIANQQISSSVSSIEKEISKMQSGGPVPKLRGLTKRDDLELNKGFDKILGNLIQKKVDEAIREVQKQMMPGKYTEYKKDTSKGEEGEKLDTSPGSSGSLKVTSTSPDFWLLVTAALFENGIPTDGYQGAADAAQAIYNRVSLPGWPKSIKGVILQPGQFQPVSDYGGVNEWSKINSKETAIAFAKKYKGYTGNIVEKIAAALLDRSKQEKARTFVGPRDNFRSDSFEKKYDDLDNSTEVSRYGHTFGFEPRGANIGRFKKGKLMPADINKEVVKGKVDESTPTDLGKGYGSAGGKIAGELGRFMKKKGVVPGSIHRHPEHPPYSLTSGHSPGSLHYQGRAIDLGGYANEQGPILKAVAEFNKIKGVKPVELFHAGNDPSGHSDHVHVAYQGGGLIPKQSPKNRTTSLSRYPSYSDGEMMIAIQPIIIEKVTPVSTGRGGGVLAFPGVNNTMMSNLPSLTQG
jgi:hypothetical protein